MKILVSACLLGENCKYNGGNNYNQNVMDYIKGHEVVSVCPEVMAGLGAPRDSAELVDGVVRTKTGRDIDSEFHGDKYEEMLAAMEYAKKENIDLAILQSRSPTCGVNQIYDGSFQGKLIQGKGIFAAALEDAGYQVMDAEDLV